MDERRGDWEHGVDENLASINTGQSEIYRNYRELRRQFASLSKIVNGNPEEHDPGFDARIEKIEDSLRRINGTLWADPSGSKGLVAEILEMREGREERRDKRGNLTKIIIAIISSGAIGLFWNDIRTFIKKPSKDPLDVLIQKTTHPTRKRYHLKLDLREKPPENDPENTPKTTP